TPVPGYDAPGERTTGPGTRVVVTLAGIAEQAWCDSALSLPQHGVAAPLGRELAAVAEQLQLSAPPELIRQLALVWAAVFGSGSTVRGAAEAAGTAAGARRGVLRDAPHT